MTFDQDKLDKAIKSGTITFPHRITREERRKYIREALKTLKQLPLS